MSITTHVGRKEDEVSIEDIKNEIKSAKPAEAIDGEILMCGGMVSFRLSVYPNGNVADQVGNVSSRVMASSLGKREWMSVELLAGENSTGTFLKTSTTDSTQITKLGNMYYTDTRLLSHDSFLSEENSSFFPNGVLTIKANVKIRGEKTLTHTKLPGKSITAAQLKGEKTLTHTKLPGKSITA